MDKGTWYLDACERIGLTVDEASYWFGVSRRLGRRWAEEKSVMPHAVIRLIQVMDMYGFKASDLPWRTKPWTDDEFYKATSTIVQMTSLRGRRPRKAVKPPMENDK